MDRLIIGIYFKDFDEAMRFCLKKQKRTKERWGVMAYEGGNLVLSEKVYFNLGLPMSELN